MTNPFDQFDAGSNPFDRFDATQKPKADAAKPKRSLLEKAGDFVVNDLKTGVNNLIEDYRDRSNEAGARIYDDVMGPDHSFIDKIPGVRGGKLVLDTLNAAFVPFAAIGDQFTRPIEAATGGRIPHRQATDVISAVAPILGEANAARQMGKAADAAGMTQHAYEQMLAQRAATKAAEAAARRRQAVKPQGPVARAAAPFAARFSDKAATEQAGRVLAENASDVSSVRESLAAGPDEIVPGSTPTTFQQTGDMGLGALERGVATRNPAEFNQRRADQNAARVSALEGVQAGADPNDIARALRAHLDELDAATQADVDSRTATAQARASDMGGAGTPETYGADLRANLAAAEDATRQRERALWNAVDPHGDLTGNVTHTIGSAKEIAGKVAATARPMEAEESAIFEAAQGLKPLSPVSDLIALRSRVSAAMRQELRTNGQTPSYARMAQLRGTIQENLSTSIAHQVALDDAAVARGMLAPEQTLRARLRDDSLGWQRDRVSKPGDLVREALEIHPVWDRPRVLALLEQKYRQAGDLEALQEIRAYQRATSGQP